MFCSDKNARAFFLVFEKEEAPYEVFLSDISATFL